jgi:hypothetical protein
MTGGTYVNKALAGAEGTIAQLPESLPERDAERMVGLGRNWQTNLGRLSVANQIADAHLGAAKAVPPKLDKGAPATALAI